MGVDTRDKRASAIGIGLPFRVLPNPGTIDQPDRQHVGYLYRAITAANPVVILGDLITTANAYFRRTVTTADSITARHVTVADAIFRRSVTTEDAER